MSSSNQEYVEKHPEIKTMLSGLVRALLESKPADVEQFALEHLQQVVENRVRPPPLVIVGPSGVGKGTLIGMLMKEFGPNALGFSVSHTTRAPRPGEEPGVHYHFASHEEIRLQVDQGEFLEHAEVHGNIYGTSFQAVSTVQCSGKVCILDIDVQGVKAIKNTPLQPKTVFIAPPSHEKLEERLRARGTEKEEAILKRLATAHTEMRILEEDGVVDCQIVNDDLQQAYQELRKQVLSWYPHIKPV